MKLTPALFALEDSFAFLIFLGGIFLANDASAQEKPLAKSVDSVGRQAIKSVVENKKNEFKNKLKEQTSQFTDTAKRKSAVQAYVSKHLTDIIKEVETRYIQNYYNINKAYPAGNFGHLGMVKQKICN